MIEVHADDFGLFPEQSERIIRCLVRGKLNGISVMPNSPYLDACMQRFASETKDKKIYVTVHLNLVEGKALCKRESVSLLTDERQIFAPSFAKLLVVSYLPFVRKRYFAQIKDEITAQIKACEPYMNGENLRLDGHCHFHMLPVVFDAIVAAMEEQKLKVEFIRMPKEDIGMYVKLRKRMEAFRWINLAKVLILNVLVWRNRKVLNKHGFSHLDGRKSFFSGVMYSGRMGLKNAQAVVNYVKKSKMDRRMHVEVLLHPGGVYESEDLAKVTDAGDLAFLSDQWRRKEEQAAMKLLTGR